MTKKKKTDPPDPPKLALLCPIEMPGVSTVMRNMAAIKPDFCEFFLLKSKIIKDLPDQFHSAPLVILGGWDPEFYPTLCKRRNGVSILLCSSMGQIDLSGIEMRFIQQIYELKQKGHVDSIIVGSIEVFMALRRSLRDLHWMPYPVNIDEYGKFTYKTKTINYVGLFMPLHGRKNVLNQIYAVAEANEILKTLKKPGLELKTNIEVKLDTLPAINLGWTERSQYLKTIRDLKLGLHVTFTESFGYGALDYLLSGVPVLMSPTVALNLKIPQDYEWSELVIINVDSQREISGSIVDLLTMDEENYKQLSMGTWAHARSMSRKQNVEFAIFIEKFAGISEEIGIE